MTCYAYIAVRCEHCIFNKWTQNINTPLVYTGYIVGKDSQYSYRHCPTRRSPAHSALRCRLTRHENKTSSETFSRVYCAGAQVGGSFLHTYGVFILSILSCTVLFDRSFTVTLNQQITNWSTYLATWPYKLIHSLIHSSIHSFIHSFIPSGHLIQHNIIK